MVGSTGTPPRGGAVERYQLPPGTKVVADEFQSVEGDVVTVRSDAVPSPLVDPKPFLAKEAQLETDDPVVRSWVEGIVAGRTDGADIAESLRLAVRSHITVRDLTVADGSALETFRNKKGDCTEHANLLCAALRIAGIPARVDVGVVHVFVVDKPAWCGHAWVSAWIDGHWITLDAAYPGIARSKYLRLGSANGADGAKANGAMLAAMALLMGKEIKTVTGQP